MQEDPVLKNNKGISYYYHRILTPITIKTLLKICNSLGFPLKNKKQY